MTQRVFVDANILYSKTLMDWLFFLRDANPSMFQTHCTEDVFAEVVANLRERYPRAPGHKIRNRVKLMRNCIDEVVGDFAGTLNFSGRDEKDYHVHAAATAACADFILTCNKMTDFTTAPDDEKYEVIHPDTFFIQVVDSAPHCLMPIVFKQIAYWKSHSNLQLDEALVRAGCPTFAERVKKTIAHSALLPL